MLWYGIGILYDRYGSYDYAEEAFSQVMNIQPDFEKANEIYFRLGIIYKQQNKWNQSLDVSFLVSCPLLMRAAHTYSVLNTSSTPLLDP
jgi:lipoprotein NlpI